MITTGGQCYIVGLKNLQRLAFQHFPEELAPTRSAKYADIEVVARNNPFHHYINGNETLSFELDFYSMNDNRDDVREKVNWLKGLTYSIGRNKAPERVKIVFGELFKDEVWIVTNVAPRYSQFNKEFRCLPMQAYVNITLSLDPDEDLYAEDIRGRLEENEQFSQAAQSYIRSL